MQWALDHLKGTPDIESNTENYTTYPKYEQQRIVGWRSAQTLVLSGSDFDAIKSLLQTLQSKLQVQNMLFRPSIATRRDIEDNLINQALDNFKHRARIVQDNMGAAAYRILEVNINSGGFQPGRMRMRNSNVAAARSASVESAPAVEGGQSQISVSVTGQIQLQ